MDKTVWAGKWAAWRLTASIAPSIGCSSNGQQPTDASVDGDDAPSAFAGVVIGASGGVVVSDDGRVELTFPPRALLSETIIRIEPVKLAETDADCPGSSCDQKSCACASCTSDTATEDARHALQFLSIPDADYCKDRSALAIKTFKHTVPSVGSKPLQTW